MKGSSLLTVFVQSLILDSFITTRINFFLLSFACQKILNWREFLRMYRKGFINVILKLLSHWYLVKSTGNRFEEDILWFLSAVLSISIVFYWFLVSYTYFTGCDCQRCPSGFAFQYLSLCLPWWLYCKGRKTICFPGVALDQHPVLEAGDVLRHEHSDRVEETYEWRL